MQTNNHPTRRKSGIVNAHAAIVKSAAYGSPDKPLRLGAVEVPCFVLDDGSRVVTTDGFLDGVGYTGSNLRNLSLVLEGIASKTGGLRFTRAGKPLTSFDPTPFRMPNGAMAQGLDATLFADVCGLVVEAALDGRLRKNQAHLARQCNQALVAFGKVGIVALIDEVTGYQNVRKHDELQAIIALYVPGQMRAWANTYPLELFEEICRLKGWKYDPIKRRFPRHMGNVIKDLTYYRLPQGVSQALDAKNPVMANGRRKNRHHQFIGEGEALGHLKYHLSTLVTLARNEATWDGYKARVDGYFPKPGQQRIIPGLMPPLAA